MSDVVLEFLFLFPSFPSPSSCSSISFSSSLTLFLFLFVLLCLSILTSWRVVAELVSFGVVVDEVVFFGALLLLASVVVDAVDSVEDDSLKVVGDVFVVVVRFAGAGLFVVVVVVVVVVLFAGAGLPVAAVVGAAVLVPFGDCVVVVVLPVDGLDLVVVVFVD